MPSTRMSLAKIVMLRTERVDPKCEKSSTEMRAPRRAMPKIDNDDAKRFNDRTDNAEPK